MGDIIRRCAGHIGALLVRLQPVAAPSAVGDKGYAQTGGSLHLLNDNALDEFFLRRHHAEVEFVVYLQNHAALHALGLHAFVDADHGNLYDVCRTALYGGVYGVALGIAAHGGVVAVDVGQMTLALPKG